jgi:hypothetical protein
MNEAESWKKAYEDLRVELATVRAGLGAAVGQIDEARRLAEHLNDERNHWGPGRVDLPWEV